MKMFPYLHITVLIIAIVSTQAIASDVTYYPWMKEKNEYKLDITCEKFMDEYSNLTSMVNNKIHDKNKSMNAHRRIIFMSSALYGYLFEKDYGNKVYYINANKHFEKIFNSCKSSPKELLHNILYDTKVEFEDTPQDEWLALIPFSIECSKVHEALNSFHAYHLIKAIDDSSPEMQKLIAKMEKDYTISELKTGHLYHTAAVGFSSGINFAGNKDNEYLHTWKIGSNIASLCISKPDASFGEVIEWAASN